MAEFEENDAGRVCQISMLGSGRDLSGDPCGRKIHRAPQSVDAEPVCLMHSKDPAKNAEEFHKEIERVISAAELANSSPDFTEFVFPSCDFRSRKFARGCTFIQTTFTGRAGFASALFGNDVFFYEAKFLGGADFSHARFGGIGMFMRSEFRAESLFTSASFEGAATFMSARFEQKADFSHTRFQEALEFHETRFRHDLADSPGLDFSSVDLKSPEKVKFYRTDLGQALIFQTDVSRVNFALVEWRDRGRVRNYRIRRAVLRVRLALEFWAKASFSGIRNELMRAKRPRRASRLRGRRQLSG